MTQELQHRKAFTIAMGSMGVENTLELYGAVSRSRISYHLVRQGETFCTFRSRATTDVIEACTKKFIDEMNTFLLTADDSCTTEKGFFREPEKESRLEEIMKEHGSQLSELLLDKRGYSIFSNWLADCGVLSILGDCITGIPWELAYLAEDQRGRFISPTTLVSCLSEHSANPSLAWGTRRLDSGLAAGVAHPKLLQDLLLAQPSPTPSQIEFVA